jgi:site-specific recombinase XerD
MSRVGLYNVITNKIKKAKIAKSGVHILRHTFARNLVSKNVNLKTISELLGHADITLTARLLSVPQNVLGVSTEASTTLSRLCCS